MHLPVMSSHIGKEFKTMPNLSDPQTMTEPAVKATVAILNAMIDPERDKVVVICHSQGTIITANVIRALKKALIKLGVDSNEPKNLDDTLTFLEEIAFDMLNACIEASDDKNTP